MRVKDERRKSALALAPTSFKAFVEYVLFQEQCCMQMQSLLEIIDRGFPQ